MDKQASPPHNEHAEQYILGAVLHAPSCLPAVAGILRSKDFYLDRHAQIFDACLDLGESIDIATVAERLKSKGHGRDDDFSYLLGISSDLIGASKAAQNAVASATLVKRTSLQRRQQRLAQEMIEKPNLDRDKIKSELGEIEAELARLDGQKKDSWTVYTPKDACAKRDPLQYIISGLFTLPSLSITYGAPAALKTFLLADAGLCVAGGIPFLGREVIQCPAMLVDFDNGARRTHERIEALLRGHALPETIPFFYVSMPSPWLNAGNQRDVENLIQRTKDRSIKFIIIDNLGLISGGADENSAEMIQVMGNLRVLAERTGAALVVIHHERKSNGTGGRPGEAVRGHSSIEAALDLAVQVEREQHSNIITIKSTKTRDLDVLPFGAEFRYEHKIGTGELSTAFFVPYEVEDNLSDDAIEKAIKDVLEASPLLNQAELVEKVKAQGVEAGKNRIGPIANRMADKGRIVVNSGRKGAKLYSLI